jgi:hypothetical protein
MEESLKSILSQEKLGHHIDLFVENGIVDIEVFKTLDLADLKVTFTGLLVLLASFALRRVFFFLFFFFAFSLFFSKKEYTLEQDLLTLSTLVGHGSYCTGRPETSYAGD